MVNEKVAEKPVDVKPTAPKPAPKGMGGRLITLVSGSMAGTVAKTVIAPADRIKIVFQASNQKFTYRACMRVWGEIYREQGLMGWWRGHGAMLARVAPYAGVQFASFQEYTNMLQPLKIDPLFKRFLAGCGAGFTATTATYPLDVLRARMAMQEGGYVDVVRDIIAERGVVGLFAGWRPTVLGIMPYAGLSFGAFETLKAYRNTWLQKKAGEEGKPATKKDQIPVFERLAMGAAAGLWAQSCTYPLEVIRRRMQVKGYNYRNEAHAFKTILNEEGVGALFKGLSMNFIKGPIASGIAFTVNDLMKRYFGLQSVGHH